MMYKTSWKWPSRKSVAVATLSSSGNRLLKTAMKTYNKNYWSDKVSFTHRLTTMPVFGSWSLDCSLYHKNIILQKFNDMIKYPGSIEV